MAENAVQDHKLGDTVQVQDHQYRWAPTFKNYVGDIRHLTLGLLIRYRRKFIGLMVSNSDIRLDTIMILRLVRYPLYIKISSDMFRSRFRFRIRFKFRFRFKYWFRLGFSFGFRF